MTHRAEPRGCANARGPGAATELFHASLLQMDRRGRIGQVDLPVRYVRPEPPCESGTDVRLDGILQLPSDFAHHPSKKRGLTILTGRRGERFGETWDRVRRAVKNVHLVRMRCRIPFVFCIRSEQAVQNVRFTASSLPDGGADPGPRPSPRRPLARCRLPVPLFRQRDAGVLAQRTPRPGVRPGSALGSAPPLLWKCPRDPN